MAQRGRGFCWLVMVLYVGTSGSVFFDFFGKPQPPQPKAEKRATGDYGQLKLLRRIRRSADVEERWQEYCRQTGFKSTTDMPAEVLQEFLSNPLHHETDTLKSFASAAKLPAVSIESDDDEDFGGFMDANLYGLVQSDKQREEERSKLVLQVSRYILETANAEKWRRFCLQMSDPDDEESKAVRAEMAVRSEIGRRKTPLESWLDAETGKAAPSGNKWGV
mmetsp:Transcript_42129/g.78314  ORF Transcript_42129/g.78314 Transcript_42129/m.78314 type:complete len:220 (+) Transcript_42129:56-715(+)